MPNPPSPLPPHGLSSAAARMKCFDGLSTPPAQVCAAKYHMPMG
ncbi:MAG: hypothetical protein QMD04_14125 [Anaerolineales bacterium]|nr:hypothetical protein [Anaerolineales bacterium]